MTRRKTARNPKLAIAYLRVSTDRQDLGIDAQRAAIAMWAATAGIDVLDWHEDQVSGGANLTDRPALMAAIVALKASDAGVFVVAKRDRLARDRTNAGLVEREINRVGALVKSADGVGGDADDPIAQAMAGMVDVFAEFERAMIRARTRAALRVKRDRGDKFNGTPPYGFALSADGLRFEPCDAEAAAMAMAAELRAGGASLRAIGRELDAHGFKARGAKWHPFAVSLALREGRNHRPKRKDSGGMFGA